MNITQRISATLSKSSATDPFLTLLGTENGDIVATYAQLVGRACQWQRYLQQHAPKHSKVVVILKHGLDLYSAYIGAVFAGMIPSMFAFPSPKLSKEVFFASVEQLLKNVDAHLIVTYPELKAELSQRIDSGLKSKLQIISIDQFSEAGSDLSSDKAQLINFLETSSGITEPADSIAFMQFSSGTTGLKKAVGISHSALQWQIDEYAKSISLGQRDKIVSWLPLYHDMGLIACFWLPILTNTPLVAMSALNWVSRPSMLIEAISQYKCTLCWLPNFAYNHLSKTFNISSEGLSLASLRGVINCSEPLMYESHQIFLSTFSKLNFSEKALWASYAMAENTFAVSQSSKANGTLVDWIDSEIFALQGTAKPVPIDHPKAMPLVSSGAILPGCNVKILSSDGIALPERTVGEIVINSPCLIEGYYNNQELTEAAFRNGWYYTGDLGYIFNGSELVVTGRKKDLLILNGNNIYPHDLENEINAIAGVIPGRCVALGISDLKAGTDKLIVIAESNYTADHEKNKLRQAIYQRLTSHAEVAPYDILIVSHGWLLKSSSGKISRSSNREKYLQHSLLVSQTPERPVIDAETVDENSTLSGVRKAVKEVLTMQNFKEFSSPGDNDALISSGLIDSLSVVNLIIGLEKAFNIVIPDHVQWDFSNFDSIANIAKLVDLIKGGTLHKKIIAKLPDDSSERNWKCKSFVNAGKKFDTLIIGSSRIMTLSTAACAKYGLSAFNFSVNNARAEDWYCILRYALDNSKNSIKNLILGIDIEAFINLDEIDYRLPRCPQLMMYLSDQDKLKQEQVKEEARELSETERFQEIRKNIKTQNSTNLAYTFDVITGDIIYTEDEKVVAAFETRQPLKDRDIGLARQEASYKTRLSGFTALSESRIIHFLNVITICLENGIKIFPFITTVHKDLEKFLRKETTYAMRMNDFYTYINQLGLNKAVTIRDCSLVRNFGGDENDFLDAAHAGPYNADLIIDNLLKRD